MLEEPSVEEVRDIVNASGYFESFSKADASARHCRDSRTCKEAFLNSLVPLSSLEKKKLLRMVSAASEAMIRSDSPELRRISVPRPWRIAKFDGQGRGEGPYPHTRGPIIFLPQGFFSGTDESACVETLVHEAIHVWQRAQPPREGGVRIEDAIRDPDILARRRSNPDLDDRLYGSGSAACVCMQVFDRIDPTSLSQSTAAEVAYGGKLTGRTCAYEHPNEAEAYQLAARVAKSSP